MSDLESLCRALEDSVQPLPGLANSLDQRAARLRAIAAEVDHAARQVDNAPAVDRVIGAFHEAASALEASGRALLRASQQGRSYVARTISGGGAIANRADDRASVGVGGGVHGVGQGLPEGWEMVPLSAIDDADSAVVGPESFGKGYSPDDLTWAFTALNEVVLPAISRGEGSDYFQELDQAQGRAGSRSYDDTYRGFFEKGSAIKLDRRADGTFGVGNGYHRIWLARQLGLQSLPAWTR